VLIEILTQPDDFAIVNRSKNLENGSEGPPEQQHWLCNSPSCGSFLSVIKVLQDNRFKVLQDERRKHKEL
jgi:hypothetical protein